MNDQVKELYEALVAAHARLEVALGIPNHRAHTTNISNGELLRRIEHTIAKAEGRAS